MRMPPSVSVSRPVTSALILPRSRKIGRSRVKAIAITTPNDASNSSVAVVSCQLSQNSTPSAIDRRDDAADQLHQAGADEVPDALGVVHDARDQHAGLGRVEVADRQPRDVLLDRPAHLGDRALRCDAQHLRQGKAGDAWTRVAAPAAQASGHSRSARWRPMTSSISSFDVAGRTRPASRFTTISDRPSARRARRAQIRSRASRHAVDQCTFFLSFVVATARFSPP